MTCNFRTDQKKMSLIFLNKKYVRKLKNYQLKLKEKENKNIDYKILYYTIIYYTIL